MFSRYEKLAHAFIERRPALRAALLVAALIGIGKGAIDVVAPLVKLTLSPLIKLLPLSPERVEAERFSCALYNIPRSMSRVDILGATEDTSSAVDEHFIQSVRNLQHDTLACYELFGFSNRMPYTYVTKISDRNTVINELRQNLPASYAALRGHLIAKNLPAARLLVLGSEIKQFESDLRVCTLSECKDRLTLDLRQRVANVLHAHEQASKEFPYRFPLLKLEEESAADLSFSMKCWNVAVWKRLSLPTPKRIEADVAPSNSADANSPKLVFKECP